MYSHIFTQHSQEAHDPIVNNSVKQDNWPGKLASFWHAFVHGSLSQPPPQRADYHHGLFSETEEEERVKMDLRAEELEEKPEKLSDSSSSTLPVVATEELHASYSPILPKGEISIKMDVLQVMKPVLTVAANFQKGLVKRITKGNVRKIEWLVHRIDLYTRLLVFLLSVPKGETPAGVFAFKIALYEKLETILKDYVVMAEALIKGLKIAVDLGQWNNRNGILAQYHFAQMEWDFIQGTMKKVLAEARSEASTDLILNKLASVRMYGRG
ncbi:uncharacterized protein EV420DRAFT_390363 [Desarmillaria tabescens]|uniref:Uncharacterized protein n=1 Tax=Armillaria tabescens TaxID=1929756 RepID=A0AA39KBY6_ARMTA|nr:uncharacterized protein EV420DRAFT_390363 [Desarmillaria tabescens]KAK0458290.1 hypothetical protein EV420DRAFT_390363 [Desarmillaria tabescens]